MHALLKWGNEIAAQKMDDRQNSSSHAGEKKRNLQEHWFLFVIIRNNSSYAVQDQNDSNQLSGWNNWLGGSGGSFLLKRLWTELHNKEVL